MKIVVTLVFEIFLVSLMLTKPVLVSNYFFKNSNVAVVLELTESEEDKSEETSLELSDEIFYWSHVEWNRNPEGIALKKYPISEIDKEEHIREIVPPPPKA